MQIRRWNEAQLNTTLAAELAEACEIHPFLALMLTSCGLDTPEQIFSFLVGVDEEIDPFAYPDMYAAVERIRRAVEQHERILIYGDYDVDGITATVLLYTYLQKQGADVLYRIPLREDGYGLHPEMVTWASQQQVSLIVTVDTGVAAVEEVALAASLGVDVVVTDHHQPGQTLPAAVAVVDPHLEGCEAGCKELAGVGVAFMLVCALTEDSEATFADYGDLLALGTLADMMPLQGFNRDLMRRCLVLLEESRRPGIVALREIAGVSEKVLTGISVTFSLVPRLNAAGRMADPDVATKLLLSSTADEADRYARELQALNTRRQQASSEIIEQVDAQLIQHPQWLRDRVLVVCGEGWHGGLLGLVAARLMDRYGKPAIAITLGEDGVAHGSCRSLEGFSMYTALRECEQLLTAYGGHELAAGVTLRNEAVDTFRDSINAYAREAYPQMPTAALDISLRLRPDQINMEKLDLLQVLEPFGAGNPAPLFGLYRMRLDNITAIGGGKHLRLSLSRDGVRVSAVKFQTSPEEFPIPCGATVNCVVSLEKNEYRGNTSVTVRVRDISFTDTDREQLIAQLGDFDSIMRGELCPEPATATATREQLARLYNLLRTCKEWKGTPEQLQHVLGEGAPTCLQLLVALEIWQQAGLVQWHDLGEQLFVRVLPVEGKADMTTTPLWQYIMKGDVENVG
ncbi:MAG: single-stranded-DNA-specific exonuclease RecJ [Clostridia bacterium]|nr:single-stranded-DNA-specific exonuclease RecJ [Clostridia bacterium]